MSDQLTEAYENLIERYEPIVEDYDRIKAKNKDLKKELSEVQGTLEDTIEKSVLALTESQSQVDELKDQNKKLEDKQQQHAKEIQDVISKSAQALSQSQSEVNELKDRNRKLEDHYSDYDDMLTENEQTIANLAEKIKQLNKTLRTQTAERKECDALHTKTDELEKSEAKLKETVTLLKKKCNEKQALLQKENEHLEGLLRDRNAEIAKIQTQAETNRQVSSSNKTQVLDYPSRIAELSRENKDLREANRDLIDEAKENKKKFDDIKRRANRLSEFYEKVEKIEDVEGFVKLYTDYFGQEAADKLYGGIELFADADNDPSHFGINDFTTIPAAPFAPLC